MTRRTARAPASAANLGPGFDSLAVALDLHIEVTVEPAERLQVSSEGEGSDVALDANHLAARVAVSVAGHDRLAIHVRSDIPVARGLGSSAALAVAAAAAAGAPDPLAVAARAEGHPENAAAAAMGGLVAAATVDGQPVGAPLGLDPELVFVILVPERRLPTKQARMALPPSVPHGDAAFNLGRLALLIAGLGDARLLTGAAFDDRLHQPARAKLFPEAPGLLGGLRSAGALGACWSGAGSSLLAVCTAETAPSVQAAGQDLLTEAGVVGQVLLLEADLDGVVVG